MVWPSDGSAPTTVPEAAGTTTSDMPTTTTSASTTTTLDPLQVRDVETVEQAEAILRELWFGWFEGIYNQDEDRIREVVATEERVSAAKEQFGVMTFTHSPTLHDISLSQTEILRIDRECLAVWTVLSADFREGSSSGVHVLRWIDGRWVSLSNWVYRDDLWEADCDAFL